MQAYRVNIRSLDEEAGGLQVRPSEVTERIWGQPTSLFLRKMKQKKRLIAKKYC